MDWNPFNQFFPSAPADYGGGAPYPYPLGDEGHGIAGEEFNNEADEWIDDPYAAQPSEPTFNSVRYDLISSTLTLRSNVSSLP